MPMCPKPQGQKPSGKTNCHWHSIPPKEGESQTKVMDGISFKWCAKCRCWSTTHATATHTGIKHNANKGSQGGNHLSTAPPHPSTTSSALVQANLFLVLDPSTWLMSLESPTVFDFFRALVGLFLTFQFPIFTLVAVSVITYLWSADVWDYMVVVLAPFVQWFLVNLLPSILVFFWIMLLVMVVVLPLCSWFRVDP